MKVLYVGSLDPFGTSYSRYVGLQKIESEVHGFDADEHLAWSRVPRFQAALESHALRGPRHHAANAALLSAARELRPDAVWVDKGDWIRPATLKGLRAEGIFLVSHNTDAMHPASRRVSFKRRLLRATAPCYDIFFTTNDVDCERMQGGPQQTLFTDLGYDDRRFEPTPLPSERAAEWDHGLVFVGHHEPHTEAGVLALIEAGLPVKVFGHAPWFASPNRARLGDHLQPSLGNEDYVRALKGARIGLCWVSSLNYNQTAARSFEIPGCGTFLLAMRTRQHAECFEEGKEAEFFGGPDELVEKARYYLEHEDERQEIARRGQERCVSSGYSWDALMKRDWARVLEIHAAERGS
jgi:glycosyltransferase involved in cell wall biosynthesis